MGKELALYDKVYIDGQDVSNYCRGVASTSTNEQIDDSGFSASGNDEFLAGKRTQDVTFEFMLGEELHQILWPLHRDRDVFPIIWQPAGLIDATRSKLTGNAQLLTYPPGATRGDVRSVSAQFSPGDSAGFSWVEGAS